MFRLALFFIMLITSQLEAQAKPFCNEFNNPLELFVNFKPESKFYSNLIKEETETLITSCK